MVHQRVGHIGELGPGVSRAKAEIGVLPPRRRKPLVEPAQPLQDLTRVGDVAGRVPVVRFHDLDAASAAVVEVALGGVGLGAPLEDPVARVGGRDQALEPVRSRPAVVVGERDQRRAGGAPSEVALGGRAGWAAKEAHREARGSRDQRFLGVAGAFEALRVADEDALPHQGGGQVIS